jgi:hypothetical protein
VESGGVVGKSLSGRVAGVLLAVRGFFESMRVLDV